MEVIVVLEIVVQQPNRLVNLNNIIEHITYETYYTDIHNNKRLIVYYII